MLVLVIGIDVVVIGAVAVSGGDPLKSTMIIIACLLGIVLIASMILRTVYVVDGDVLTIWSGPFRFKIPLRQIESVRASKSPLSSPALSLDRLVIRYGRRRIMVSPADKMGFLNAIGQDLGD